MKAVILAAVVCLIGAAAFGASGPLDRGAVMLGGQAYVTTFAGDLYDAGDKHPTQVFVAPTVGVFIGPGVMLGGQLAFSHINVPYGLTEMLAGPVAQYYIGGGGSMRGQTSAYVSASVLYHSIHHNYEGYPYAPSSYSYTDTGASLALELGGVYFLNEGVAIDFGIRYQHDTIEHVSGNQIIGTVGIATYLW